MRRIHEMKRWDVVHELRKEDALSEDLPMRVNGIAVEEVDGECYVWLDEKLLALTPQQAQQLADDLQEAMRARWRPQPQRAKPQRQEILEVPRLNRHAE